MSAERLSGLALILVHRDLAINIDIITDMFARSRPCRMRIVTSLVMRTMMTTKEGEVRKPQP